MSAWGWAARIGGFAAAPFTAGYSIPAGLAAGSALDHRGSGNGSGDGTATPEHPEDPYTAILKQKSADATDKGNQFGDMSSEALTPVLNYFKSLMSSNPNAILDATRSDRGRVIDQFDTARRAAAQFGPRGGGETGVLADSQFKQAESLADVTSDARSKAATSGAALGTSLASLGLQADELASTDIEHVINTVLAREGLNVQRRGQNLALLGDVGETIGTLIGLSMGKGGSGGGGGA